MFVGVSLGVLVGVSVLVGVGVSVLVGVTDAVFVGVDVLVGVTDAVFVGVKVFVGVAVGVGKGHPPKNVTLPSPSATIMFLPHNIKVSNTSKKKSIGKPSQSVPTKEV